jgi:DNA-binding transcriptional MerR regulator
VPARVCGYNEKVGSDKSELMTLEAAAAIADVSIQTFRLFVASGNVKAEKMDGKAPLFSRTDAERVGSLQRDAVEQARHMAVEKLAAELVVMRESLLNQDDMAQRLAAQEASLAALGAENAKALEVLRDQARVQTEQVADGAKNIEELTARLAEARTHLGELRDVVAGLIQAGDAATQTLEAQHRLLEEQNQVIDGLRAEQKESRQRINHLLDRLADAFFQVRSEPAEAAETPSAAAKPKPPSGPSKPASKASAPPEPDVEPEPSQELAVKETAPPAPAEKAKAANVPPAKVGVIREIEFNYLLERMGYRRLDAYSTEELDAGAVRVPDDDTIREFLSANELGCEVDEVDFSSVTRGGWQMIQYQRVEKKNGKRPWIAAKR